MNVLLVNFFILNGAYPFTILDRYATHTECQQTVKEISQSSMPANEYYDGICITVNNLDIKPNDIISGDMKKFDDMIATIRNGKSSLKVVGIHFEQKHYEMFNSLETCGREYEFCAYTFQEFSFNP